jgi:hypothetical protein
MSSNQRQWDKLQTLRYTPAKFEVDPCNIDRHIVHAKLFLQWRQRLHLLNDECTLAPYVGANDKIVYTYWENTQTTSPSVNSYGRPPIKIHAESLYWECHDDLLPATPSSNSLSFILFRLRTLLNKYKIHDKYTFLLGLHMLTRGSTATKWK